MAVSKPFLQTISLLYQIRNLENLLDQFGGISLLSQFALVSLALLQTLSLVPLH